MPTRIDNAEIYRAGERLPVRDPFMEKIAWVMDGMIPVGPFTIGLDSVLGLVPGFGDVASALISMLIVARAVHAGIPRVAVARMMTNIAIDTLIGSIPFLGDLFDVAYKSNIRNLRIYEEWTKNPGRESARSWGFFVALLLGIAAVILAIGAAVVALVRAI